MTYDVERCEHGAPVWACADRNKTINDALTRLAELGVPEEALRPIREWVEASKKGS